ncbi:hypothetical protein [Nocardia sp. CA-119907]|uniref:hypothetical protein n=1 Tax=Nocardia sp. CA-119907 TaxID=3239973 RepID=UPI003D9674C9
MPAPLEDRVTNLETLVAALTIQQAEAKAKAGSPTDLAALGAKVARNHDAFIEEIGSLRAEINDRFSAVDDRFSAVGDRFSAVDDRLSAVDDRLSAIDDRLSAVGDRLSAMDVRLSGMDDRFSDVGGKLDRILAALGVDRDGA